MIQSATAYRQVGARATLLGAIDSLENIVSSPLPDGAECWVIENASVYRFDKSSVETADGARIVAPIAGGGRWYRLSISPIQIQSVSSSYGLAVGNTSTSPGQRMEALTFLDVPAGSSVLAYGTISTELPTVDAARCQITYQSSGNTALQIMPRSIFFESAQLRRSMAASGFLGPFVAAQSWVHIRLNMQSAVANSVTIQLPPDQISLTAMILPPLTKV